MAKKKKLSIIGLLLNLIGTVILAFSLKIVTGVTFGTLGESGTAINPYQLTIDPYIFHSGLAVIFLGFLLQLIEKIKK